MVRPAADTVFALDLDRTMANTRLYDLAKTVLQQLPGVDYAMLRQVRSRIEADGGSFDFVRYLTSVGASIDDFVDRYREAAEQHGSEYFRADGATELMLNLSTRQIPFLFVTYGGERWQTTKLQAAGYDSYPYVITSAKEKGRLIASWRQADGRFVIAIGASRIEGRQVILVDDKRAAFSGLPPGTKGIWLTQDGAAIEINGDSLPIITSGSLLEVNRRLDIDIL